LNQLNFAGFGLVIFFNATNDRLEKRIKFMAQLHRGKYDASQTDIAGEGFIN